MTKFGGLSRWHKETLTLLERLGLEITEVRQNNNIVIKGELNGKPFQWTTAKTPSVQNAPRKMIADLKRSLRGCGVVEMPEFAIKFYTGIPQPSDVWDLVRCWERSLEISSNEDA
ncbi:hypothetical protein [Magnetospirillum moscoviense]|uniref:hypothetical protein n=1 Tax=Magnetospirillum moscoviense TaxID=1437059 RepID=UPI0012E89AE4|nr:hypothetical protein [Magnetospirillum moscoviense]